MAAIPIPIPIAIPMVAQWNPETHDLRTPLSLTDYAFFLFTRLLQTSLFTSVARASCPCLPHGRDAHATGAWHGHPARVCLMGGTPMPRGRGTGILPVFASWAGRPCHEKFLQESHKPQKSGKTCLILPPCLIYLLRRVKPHSLRVQRAGLSTGGMRWARSLEEKR